jgi:hypothetical protein
MAALPRFAAEASLYRTRQQWAPLQRYAGPLQSQLVPAQVAGEPCVTTSGACTPPSGGTSIASNQGFRQVCEGPSQVAWVEVCRSNWGTGPVTSVNRGCDPCGDGSGGGGGGTGDGGNPCAPGTPCAGSCCPAGSVCSTVVGTTTTVCCPTAFPVARPVPILGIRCFPF